MDKDKAFPGGIFPRVAISVGVFLVVVTFVCSLCKGHLYSRANVGAASSTTRTATAGGVGDGDDEYEEQGRPRRASPAAGLPSFTYNQSVRHNATSGGGGEEAATCSVCLSAFQGETVRLLPVRLHLYHVECIDPWLDAHSTCPICRSGMDGSLHLPV